VVSFTELAGQLQPKQLANIAEIRNLADVANLKLVSIHLG
jgi:hypothetical protein